LIFFLPALATSRVLAACDRQTASAPQGEATNGANAATPANGTETATRYPTGRLARSHAGTAAPATSFQDPQGHPTNLAAFRGRPLLVNLWATWCGPCVVEMPHLDRLAAAQRDRIQVLAISQDTDGRDLVTRFFAARHFVALQPYLDPQLDIMMALRVDTLPTTILYDAQGREVWRMTGMAEWGDERTTRLLGEATAR
jgi:thiol-disulfide isomerase/thioredoxin